MRFFFYGTLMEGSGNAVEPDVHAMLRPLGPATARGRLFAIPDLRGWYPALLAGAGQVRGRLYETGHSFCQAALARLDAYEDFDPADPQASLYLREPIPVTDERDLRGTAEVYRFNRPLPAGARRIRGGDFRAWLDETGYRQFGGLRSS